MGISISGVTGATNPYLNRVKVVNGHIIEQDTDAIVTLIPQNLEYRGSINQSIQDAAGEMMDAFMRENVVRPKAGDVYAVPGFNLPCKHIFFCVVPIWKDEWDRNDRQLINASRKAMELARSMSLKSIAIPPVGSGSRGFPKPRAARLIVQGVLDRLDDHFEDVRIVCQTDDTRKIFEERLAMASILQT